jgi:predicted transcriptional regulator of viral defense system
VKTAKTGNEGVQSKTVSAHSDAQDGPMAELRHVRLAERDKVDAEGLIRTAEAQHGVMSSAQLRSLGLTRAAISRWASTGRLHRIHPHVYALGHPALSLTGRIWAALLYAGPDAVLSHTTAAWTWRLIDTGPTRIHLTVPGRRPSLPGVRVHHSRSVERAEHRDLPVTPVPRTLIDLASQVSARQTRRALAEADFLGVLSIGDVKAALTRARPGSAALRAALQRHMPQLAQTLSRLEERFLELCDSAGIPLPEVNGKVGAMRVDALWRERRVAVELDGGPAHGGAAAMKRDRRRELALRSMGFVVVRYSWEQIVRRPSEVAADLRELLGLVSTADPRPRRSRPRGARGR